MKKNYLRIISGFLISAFTVNIGAQSDEIANLMKAGKEDINTLAEGYLKPLGTGFAANMGQGWYNTGAVHKILGFDITLGVQLASAPTADQAFTLTEQSLKSLRPEGVAAGQAFSVSTPTFAGDGDGQKFYFYTPAITHINNVELPDNLKQPEKAMGPIQLPGVVNFVPGLSAQIALGLPFGTEVKFRYVPTVSASGFKLGLWGFAVQHDIKQWIPVVNMLPFDASALIGYTKLTTGIEFGPVTPGSLGSSTEIRDAVNNPAFWDDQKFELLSSALTANVIVSKKLLFFTPYLGFGFTSTNFSLGIKGKYPILASPDADPNNQILVNNLPNTNFDPRPVVLNQKDVGYVENPVDLSYSSFMPNATIGFRLKILFVLALHAQYTIQKYPIISAGFGINIR